MSVPFAALRARFREDTMGGGVGATPGLTRALDRIGWRAVRDPSPEELAGYVVYLLEACVDEHQDVAALTHALAALLRDCGPLLDGGLPPVDAYTPAAEELLREYVAPSASAPGFAPPGF
ncbi:hypothetical protein [Roseisolibacter agri]|uniref:Uncharacterized protein n=1 Tax=Roseisolibacter agri TaxID=2014610 RepID=A0AA37Q5W8_9BACT|nr:hypothetical protein [Roseisolibacter agri]GLC23551.1 hypothetical protein rosag_00640 [Roseisolibacter agri]